MILLPKDAALVKCFEYIDAKTSSLHDQKVILIHNNLV